jgi:hypothetical protein
MVLVFLEKKELLLKHEATRSDAWLGLKLFEGEMAVLPWESVTWKCLVLPLLWPGPPLNSW